MPAFRARPRGFTLIEIMITVAILAIVASLSLPAYRTYVQRSRTPAALDALSIIQVKMEQLYQDRNDGTYGTAGPTCPGISLGSATNFTLSCRILTTTTYIATATGTGPMANYAYTINQNGDRVTTAHPKGTNGSCWTTKGGAACDS